MIVTRDDIHRVNRLLDEISLHYETADDEVEEVPQDPVFFARRPHLLMVLGYDEFRALKGGLRSDRHDQRVMELYGLSNYWSAFPYESVYRQANSGVWYWYEGMDPDSLHFKGPSSEPDRNVSVREWLNTLNRIHGEPDQEKRTLWLPSIWTPQVQRKQRLILGDAVGEIIRAVHSQSTAIRAIPWDKLEELVAELLRGRGLQVHVTPRSADGGRDIIARGELIPGEPTVLAVEVKQKPVVGLADVQRALRANEDFPALMVATAGRFSAGVVKEKERNRNNLRLFLKDGVALTQWIDSYMGTRARSVSSGPNRTMHLTRKKDARK